MARVKKTWSAQNVDEPHVELEKDPVEAPGDVMTDPASAELKDPQPSQEEAPVLLAVVDDPVPPPPVPVQTPPAKPTVAKTYQAGDEYALDGKRGKVIVVLRDMIKVRWSDGSIGFAKK